MEFTKLMQQHLDHQRSIFKTITASAEQFAKVRVDISISKEETHIFEALLQQTRKAADGYGTCVTTMDRLLDSKDKDKDKNRNKQPAKPTVKKRQHDPAFTPPTRASKRAKRAHHEPARGEEPNGLGGAVPTKQTRIANNKSTRAPNNSAESANPVPPPTHHAAAGSARSKTKTRPAAPSSSPTLVKRERTLDAQAEESPSKRARVAAQPAKDGQRRGRKGNGEDRGAENVEPRGDVAGGRQTQQFPGPRGWRFGGAGDDGIS